jgi:hypothetical protein
MENSKILGLAFIAIAMAFLSLGITTQRIFLASAIAFLVIGIIFIARSKSIFK